MVNLSIYVNETSSLYNYAEYEILANKSVAICHRVKMYVMTHEARKTIRDNVVLGYITFIFFVFTLLFLIFLMVTYILFPQLRTLPIKNLMNLAASLLFFEMFWLPSSFSEVRLDKPACTAMAVTEHYFLMAFFVSMSVIVFHIIRVKSLPEVYPPPKCRKVTNESCFVRIWCWCGYYLEFLLRFVLHWTTKTL